LPLSLFIFLSMVNYGDVRAGFDQTALVLRLLGLPTHNISPTNQLQEVGLLKRPPLR
jgi:hypothetical protein